MDIRPIDANALKEYIFGIPPFEIDRHDMLEMVGDQPTLSLNTLRDAIYEDAVAHGLWEEHDKYFSWKEEALGNCEVIDVNQDRRRDCALTIEKECKELLEADEDVEHFTEELADVIIVSMSVAGKLGIDIDAAVRRKMEINKARPWRHGKA